ncbi:MAG: glycosyltransferase family 1 protein [Candidatus Cryosericum sp.]
MPGDTGKALAVNATFAYDSGSPTGLGVYTRELVSRLLPEGDPTAGSVVFSNSTTFHQHVGAQCISVPEGILPEHRLSGLKRIFWLNTVLPRLMTESGCDVIYSTVPEGWVIPHSKVKQVITIHDLLPVRHPEDYPKLRHYFRFMLPMVVRGCSAIICDSDATRRDVIRLVGWPRCPMTVVPAGFNSALFHPEDADNATPAASDMYFLFVGDMRPYKNVIGALSAFVGISSQNVRFVIVGNPRSRGAQDVFDLVQKVHIQDRVVFTGYVSDDEVARLYRGALALVFPSLWEGFGLPPLEAMASGCPVITSNVASLPEVCGDAVEYVDPASVDSIRNAMERVIREPALREDLRGRGLERAKLFSWDRTAREVWQVLESVRQ